MGRGGAVEEKLSNSTDLRKSHWSFRVRRGLRTPGAPCPAPHLSHSSPNLPSSLPFLLRTLSTPTSSPPRSDAHLLNGLGEFSPGRFLNFHITVRKFYNIAERYNLINEYYALFENNDTTIGHSDKYRGIIPLASIGSSLLPPPPT